MQKRLDVGVIGCGLITQVEHLPNLLNLPAEFRVIGVADPSAKVRQHLAQRRGVPTFATAEQLLDNRPDGVVIATPDAYHVELVLMALERGIHVFVEKPLCYDAADASRIVEARDRAGRIVQVGYMKRFDPAARALRDMLAARGSIRSISVEVIDPDSWPFTAHHDLVVADDIGPALIAENDTRRTTQIAKALGFVPERAGLRGFAGPFGSSLVHDLNLVQGLLEATDTSIGEPVGAAFFNGDGGGFAAARLTSGDALVSMSWVAAPKLAHYSERISVVLDDCAFELSFPSPYLNHQPTRLIERRSHGAALESIAHRLSYAEPFVEELHAWRRAILGQAPVINTVEQAGLDMAMLCDFARLALGQPLTRREPRVLPPQVA